MTVDRMRREMSNSEFIHWGVYYARVAQRQELANRNGGAASV